MQITSRRGFTLIELLIVIAIIGILASVILVGIGGGRASARDTRRIADLKQVQTALELYYTKNGIYPLLSTAPEASNAWVQLQTKLEDAGIGIALGGIPDDPLGGSKHYFYRAEAGMGGNPGTSYVIGSELEISNKAALDGSYKGVAPSAGAAQFPTHCGFGLLYCLSLGK
ncbi:MAG: prepilin-type N-terminal cleavage/methylation domain-containing protein [Candidatus Liptonbacteria bacterium]|nr:prepilin-type N-terminal cleavage/methylation domain-containing protein [Candidatus Liptonbacteria bacterium]